MSRTLGVRDRELVNYIIEYTERVGWPPSRREIQAHMNYGSPESVQKRLDALVKEGVIERSAGIPRGIKINRQRLNEFGDQ